MNILFIVQGEGRGHMTQAVTLAGMLRRNGHQVVEVLIGQSDMRHIPEFFAEQIQTPIQSFASPNFLKTADNKHFRIYRSILYNLQRKRRKAFFNSIRFIARRIDEIKPDVVVNFYEMLVGLAYWRYKIQTPVVCIAHQFIFEHPEYIFSRRLTLTQRLLRLYTKLCRLNAHKCLALSYVQMPDHPKKKLFVAPPLLRREILELHPRTDPYILGYILNHGFADEIIRWHMQHQDTDVHVFWDKPDTPEIYIVHPNLTFHQLNHHQYTTMLGNCMAFFATAGFESVCEALYLEKPILIVPAHGEQELNADDASHAGALTSSSFDLNLLMKSISQPGTNHAYFKEWVNQAEKIIINLVTGS